MCLSEYSASSFPEPKCEAATFVRAMTQMPTTEATHARAASGMMRLLSGTAKARATVTTKRKKALSPRDVHAKTAPARAQAIRPTRRGPTERVAASSPAANANVPVIAHDDGFMPATK